MNEGNGEWQPDRGCRSLGGGVRGHLPSAEMSEVPDRLSARHLPNAASFGDMGRGGRAGFRSRVTREVLTSAPGRLLSMLVRRPVYCSTFRIGTVDRFTLGPTGDYSRAR